jgi:tetrahydromethanopterin S-methyltransferase subunit H
MLIQIKQILFLDGNSPLEAMASAWKWEQKVRKQNNNEKCAVFESYFNSLVQKL